MTTQTKNKKVFTFAVVMVVITLITVFLLSACSPKEDVESEYSSDSTMETTTEIETSIVEVTNENGEAVTNEQGEAVTQVVEIVTKSEAVTNAQGEKVTDTNGVVVTEKVTETKPYVPPATKPTEPTTKGGTTPTTTTTPPNNTKPPATKPPTTITKPPATSPPPTTTKPSAGLTQADIDRAYIELKAYAESIGLRWESRMTPDNSSWSSPVIFTSKHSYIKVIEIGKVDVNHAKSKNAEIVHIYFEKYNDGWKMYNLYA